VAISMTSWHKMIKKKYKPYSELKQQRAENFSGGRSDATTGLLFKRSEIPCLELPCRNIQ